MVPVNSCADEETGLQVGRAGDCAAAPRRFARYPRVRLGIETTPRLPTWSRGGGTIAVQGPKVVVRVPVQGRTSVNDLFLMREALVAGLGVCLLPWLLASPEIAAGRIVRMMPEYRPVGGTMYLVHPPAKPLAPKLVAFMSYLVEHPPRLILQPS